MDDTLKNKRKSVIVEINNENCDINFNYKIIKYWIILTF